MSDTDAESTPDANSRLRTIPWWRIANIVGLILLVAVVVPFVVFTVPQVVGADHSYVVLSDSMEPAMSAGDAIIVNSVAASNIEKGDIITFDEGGDDRPTTHRVIEVVEQDGTTALRTKGDANEDPDSGLVTPDQVQGRVMSAGGYLFVIPYIGYVINYADTQLGFILLFAVPVALLVLNEIWNLIVASRADTDDGDEAGSGSTAAGPDTSEAPDSDADVADGGADAVEAEAAAAAADADAEAETETEAESAESSDGGITFTAAELQLGLLVLAAFLAYSVWVAYETREVWSFGVAGGVVSAFLLLAGLYFFGGDSGDAPDPGTEPDADPGGDSTGAPPPAASADAESEAPTPGESPAVDPDVELNLLEDIVGQSADDESTTTVADGSEQHLSDGGTPSADDQGAPGSGNPDRTASATGGPEGGESSE